jgi:hypothetical protein
MLDREVIKEIEKWVSDISSSAEHLMRTGYWVSMLDSNVTDELYIACITHDIERAFPEGRVCPYDETNWSSEEYNLWHGRRSAEIVLKKMLELGVNDGEIMEVTRLIVTHEIGGDDEQNKIKDADSLSFLEIQVKKFLKKVEAGELTKENVRVKFDWMYERISSSEAKEYAKPLYEKAISKLKKYKVSFLREGA